MICFAGLPLKITDAVFADHIKVERTAIFVGRSAFAAFHQWARDPRAPDVISGPFHESLRTGRSVAITAGKEARTTMVALGAGAIVR